MKMSLRIVKNIILISFKIYWSKFFQWFSFMILNSIKFFYKLLSTLKFWILLKLKIIAVKFSYILAMCKFLQIFLQNSQFKIFTFIKWEDRYSIFWLKWVRICCIVNKNNILQIPVKMTKIFYMQLIW